MSSVNLSITHRPCSLTLLEAPTAVYEPQTKTKTKTIRISLKAVGRLVTVTDDGTISRNVYLDPGMREDVVSYAANSFHGTYDLSTTGIRKLAEDRCAYVGDKWRLMLTREDSLKLQTCPEEPTTDEKDIVVRSYRLFASRNDAYACVPPDTSPEDIPSERHGVPIFLLEAQRCVSEGEFTFARPSTLTVDTASKMVTLHCPDTVATTSGGSTRIIDFSKSSSKWRLERVVGKALADCELSTRRNVKLEAGTFVVDEAVRRMLVESIWPVDKVQDQVQDPEDTTTLVQDIKKSLSGFAWEVDTYNTPHPEEANATIAPTASPVPASSGKSCQPTLSDSLVSLHFEPGLESGGTITLYFNSAYADTQQDASQIADLAVDSWNEDIAKHGNIDPERFSEIALMIGEGINKEEEGF